LNELTETFIANRYCVEALLEKGGMARVFNVYGTHLALKLLKKDLADDVVFLRRFKREAGMLERLQYPNIVRFFSLEETGGQVFLLIDFIDGATLCKIIKGAIKPLPLETVL